MKYVVLSAAAVILVGLSALPWREAAADDDELEFDTVNMFIEYNETDQDVGIQVLLDGDPFEKVKMYDPNDKKILEIKSKRSIKQQGLSELFFESAEPSLADVPLSVFLNRFPEGCYEFEGKTIDGDEIEGEADFTHTIPAGAVITAPASPMGLPLVNANNTVIQWNSVTTTITGSTNLTIVNYEVIVEREDPDRSIAINLPPTATSVTIPAEFMEPDTDYSFEILAKEASGNQTITAGEFVTLP